MSGLAYLRDEFARVGWFIPPYIALGRLAHIARRIRDEPAFRQGDLQLELASLYGPAALAAMIVERYPRVPVIREYRMTIGEAVEAHFLGLDHIAVGGLVPVIEGAGRRLLVSRNLTAQGVKAVFKVLANDCIQEARQMSLGAVDEVISMMESFATFSGDYLYADSTTYSLEDRTNRHGIAHGKFTDAEYGSPVNFYKTIAAVDFLTFTSSFRASISWLAPSRTRESDRLAKYYFALQGVRKLRPNAS